MHKKNISTMTGLEDELDVCGSQVGGYNIYLEPAIFAMFHTGKQRLTIRPHSQSGIKKFERKV
jgi:hypothetical protein